MKKAKLKVILIGAGNRGKGYTRTMATMPDKYEVIAVAEPNESFREFIRERHAIPPELCFESWEPLLGLGKIADVAVIATMDREHYAPTMAAIEQKYDILLEKPVSPVPEECRRIALAAQEAGVRIVVCHVLRFTRLYQCLKQLIDSGRVGRIISVNHEECVGNVHQSHSFVRGNWGNSTRSSCMLLQKSCHDTDILQWLIGKPCIKVQSFGDLTYFREENAPTGAPEYCIDGCPEGDHCPYNAVKLYLEDKGSDWRVTATRVENPSDELVAQALHTTQFGKCIFRCDNDVVDHQTVNMLFEGNVTATFTMSAFTRGGRATHIMGTKGEIHADENHELVEFFDLETRTTEFIDPNAEGALSGGHSGGDEGIIETLYDYLCGTYTGSSISTIGESCDGHLIVFAAEESRRTGRVVDFREIGRAHV